ncbi:hypothetical protein PHJA_000950000 [Phtheirospermum japonicum]|uniref:Phosphorylated adapter RNA export protein n=1 Tax=Phtheirospermum japonicum TaxID=374723 RepID=A0A830BVY8_9LAMI|nr:hypothetical protein PHJA_000950000 [Phtheirospermum japonicum]
MEGGESLLDTLFDDESVDDDQDVEMLDVEEGELIEPVAKAEVGESFDVDVTQVNQESNRKNSRRNKKKKNKRKRGNTIGPNVTNVSRFVVDACKRLRERKHYLMWTAVGCLGISALSDLVKEVDAIQACGGQKTADGTRFRNGGGILWNIIKARDPNAYKEIMTKGKEFEKQLKQPLHDNKQGLKQQSEASSQSVNEVKCNNPSDGLELISNGQSELEKSCVEQKRASVLDRIRVPVSYDDLLDEGDPKAEVV